MIAPARDLDGPRAPDKRDERWRRQRRSAAPLLPTESREPAAPPVRSWKAWLLTGWILVVAACYVWNLCRAWSAR